MPSFVHVPEATILGELKPNGHRPGYDSGDPQTFKLSLTTYGQIPTVTVAGVERLADYHLIGPHDMQIAVGDYWIDEHGTRFDVIAFSEGWSYMTKAMVSRHIPRGVKL